MSGRTTCFPSNGCRFPRATPALREVFIRHHAELLTADYWRRLKASHEAEKHIEVVPYTARRAAAPAPV